MKRTIVITILFGLLSALSTYLMFESMEGFKTEIKESRNVIKELQGQVTGIEDNYKDQIQYWVAKNNHLLSQIQNTEVALSQSKQKVNSLQGKIQLLISEGQTITDTAGMLVNCDSLKEKVTLFIVETNLRDSLCDSEVNDLKVVIQNKDSAMTVCERSFSMLKQVTDSSIAFQNNLTDQLKIADRKIKRSKLKTKLLSAGVMILAGTTTILLLQK